MIRGQPALSHRMFAERDFVFLCGTQRNVAEDLNFVANRFASLCSIPSVQVKCCVLDCERNDMRWRTYLEKQNQGPQQEETTKYTQAQK